MNDFIYSPSASIKMNEQFISIQTYSGYRGHRADPDVPSFLFELDATDEALGQGLLDALSKSRCIDLSEVGGFFDLDRTYREYNQWIEFMMSRYGYKTKRALFKNMENCSAYVYDSTIEISPTYHVKLEAWDGTGDKSLDVHVSIHDTPAVIGQAIRLALSRCNP